MKGDTFSEVIVDHTTGQVAKVEPITGGKELAAATAKGDTFSEVIVDHTTGQVAKVEPITGGKELAAATAQRAATTRAKKSLQMAVDAVAKAHMACAR